MIKVRFAPSPTGPLHIGGARSALFNYLYAKSRDGVFLVRSEDTDTDRSRIEYEEEILDALTWLGISWDEGIRVGGDAGPYRQTERLHIYRSYAEKLLKEGKAYYCFCSEEELEAERQEMLARGEMVRYSGRCRHLSPEEIERRINNGEKPVVRFKVEDGPDVVVDDMVRGRVSFPRDNLGDFIIVKSDGIPTYNFAVVIDDHLMCITDVIRAEEHLSNTPRQILLYEALGWEVPRFGHISLILGEDRQKMSKRHGATSVMAYKEMGYLPEALVNFLALLGWSPEGEEEIFDLPSLEKLFSLQRVNKSPAVFDLDKLNHINREHLKRKSDEELAELARPFFMRSRYQKEIKALGDERYMFLIHAIRDYMTCLSEAVNYAAIFLERPVLGEDALKILNDGEIWETLQELTAELPGDITPQAAKAWLKDFIKRRQLPAKKVYMPLRCALTGEVHGPELPYVLAVLGCEEIRQRVNMARREVSSIHE